MFLLFSIYFILLLILGGGGGGPEKQNIFKIFFSNRTSGLLSKPPTFRKYFVECRLKKLVMI